MLSAVELSGTFRSENRENRILEVWVQPRSPLMDFVLENLRNEGFRSVSDQQKKKNKKQCLAAEKSSMEVGDPRPKTQTEKSTDPRTGRIW